MQEDGINTDRLSSGKFRIRHIDQILHSTLRSPQVLASKLSSSTSTTCFSLSTPSSSPRLLGLQLSPPSRYSQVASAPAVKWPSAKNMYGPATSVILLVSLILHFPLRLQSKQLQEFTGPSGAFNVYAGFLMANNCGLISQNDLTEDSNQLCNGGYSHGASVSCDGNHNPVSAVDTKGQHWHCSTNNVVPGATLEALAERFVLLPAAIVTELRIVNLNLS
ncbi:hypothetical protein BC629DRAFT_673693 [Irpex lacteus]|nr:hypothetical protein BC629DRAFT_673693 [Irpex lacteus]